MSRLLQTLLLVAGIVFTTMSNANENENPFEGLRNQVFNLNPNEIGLTPSTLR